MAQQIEIPVNFIRGFWPSAAATGPNSIKDAAVNGRNVLFLGPGLVVSAKGLGVGPAGLGGPRLYNLDDSIATVSGMGSVLRYRSLFYFISVETGAGIINIPAANVSLAGTGGKLQYRTATQTLNAGLAAPETAPTLEASMTAGLNNSSATAVRITRIRTSMIVGENSMGVYEESNPSPVSNVISVENKKIKFTNFPSAPAVGNLDHHDAWGIYATASNAANSPGGGGFLLLRIIPTSAVVAGVYETDWNDNELEAVNPPTTNFPPPIGELVAGLGNVIFLLNTRGGNYYSASKAGILGAFSPLAEALMSPPGKIKGFTGRATDGELFAWSDNSLQSFILSGNPLAPIYNRAIWPNTGISSPMGGCFAERDFYCFVAKAGPVMLGSGGSAETAFALPVRNYILSLNWDPSIVSVGYDPVNNAVVYAHNDDALVYMRDLNVWCLPVTLNANTGQLSTLITFNGQLIVGKGAGLFTWEGGLVNQSWFIVTAKQDAPNPMDRKNLVGFRIHCDMDGLVAKLFIDDEDTETGTAKFTLTDSLSGKHYTKWSDALLNVPCKNFQLRLSGSKKDQKIDDILFKAFYVPGLRDLV